MEASQTQTPPDDPFAAAPGDPTGGDDPFAQSDPAAEVEAELDGSTAAEADRQPAGEESAPPIVDKEGAPVQPDASSSEEGGGSAAGQRMAAEAAAKKEAEAAAEAERGKPEPPPVEPRVEPEETTEAPQEPQGAAEGGQPPEPPAGTAQGTEDGGEGDQQQPPEPTSDAKQTRLYKLLYQTGPTTWEETAIPDEYAEVVEDEKHGPQRFLKARNNDHARRLAFTIHDRPQGGITVVPVPASSWKPKRIKPAPPAPERERLEIE